MVRITGHTSLSLLTRVRSAALLLARSFLLAAAVFGSACTGNVPEGGNATVSPWLSDITDEAGLGFVHQASPIDQLHLPSISAGGEPAGG